MILFKKVTKRFGGTDALSEVNLKVNEGEFIFVVGVSGAGKTTLLRLISAQILPTIGEIEVDSLKIRPRKVEKLLELRRKIGFVFQDFKILPYKNVFENVALSLSVYPKGSFKIKEEVKNALAKVGLLKKAFFFPAQLSAGELQRVAIARAIVGNREIILADEPTGNLDPETTWSIMKIFKSLENKKRKIIVATHNTDIVNSLKKRVVLLKEGKVVLDEEKGSYKL